MERVSFRMRLLLSSSLASVAISHSLMNVAQAADPVLPVVAVAPVCNVSQPWVSVFGATDFENGGAGGEFFLPLMRECDQVIFGFGRGVWIDDGVRGGDAGIGGRWLINPDTGFGVNASAGYWESDYGTDAWRGTVGVEVFTGRFDAHVNLHIADTDDETVVMHEEILNPGEGRIWVEDFGHEIWMDTDLSGSKYERAMSGVEGEIGFRPVTAGGPNLSNLDLRIYGTGFYYWADNSNNIRTGVNGLAQPIVNYNDRYGGGIGGEARFAFDAANPGSHVYVNAKGEYDNQEDWTGFLRAGVRIALGENSGSPFTAIEQRLMDPVERANMLFNTRYVAPRTVTEHVYSPYGGQREIIGGVYFAATNTGPNADGSEGRPTNIDDAVQGAKDDNSPEGDGRIIVLQNNAELIDEDGNTAQALAEPEGQGLRTQGIELEDYTIVMAADSTVDLTGATTGNTGAYTPTDDPLVLHNGSRPVVRVSDKTVSTMITTGNYNQFMGFGLSGLSSASIGFLGNGVVFNRYHDIEIADLSGFDLVSQSARTVGASQQIDDVEPNDREPAKVNSFAAGILYQNSNNIEIDNVMVATVSAGTNVAAGNGLNGDSEGADGGPGQDAAALVEAYGFRLVDTTNIDISNAQASNIRSNGVVKAGTGGNGGAGGKGGAGGNGSFDGRAAGLSIAYSDGFEASEANISVDGLDVSGVSTSARTAGGNGGQLGGEGGNSVYKGAASGIIVDSSLQNSRLDNVSIANVSVENVNGSLGVGGDGGQGADGGTLQSGGTGGDASAHSSSNGVVVNNFSNVSLTHVSANGLAGAGGSTFGGRGGRSGVGIDHDVSEGSEPLFGGNGGDVSLIYEVNAVEVSDSDDVHVQSVSATGLSVEGSGGAGNGGDGFPPGDVEGALVGNGGQGGSASAEFDVAAVKVEGSQHVKVELVRAEELSSAALLNGGFGGDRNAIGQTNSSGNGGDGGDAFAVEQVSAVHVQKSQNVVVGNVEALALSAGGTTPIKSGDGGNASALQDVVIEQAAPSLGVDIAGPDEPAAPNTQTGGKGGSAASDTLATAVIVENSSETDVRNVSARGLNSRSNAGFPGDTTGFAGNGGSGLEAGHGGEARTVSRALGVQVFGGDRVSVSDVDAEDLNHKSVAQAGNGGSGVRGGNGGVASADGLSSGVWVTDGAGIVSVSNVMASNFNIEEDLEIPQFGSYATGGLGGQGGATETNDEPGGNGGSAKAVSRSNGVHVAFADLVTVESVLASSLASNAVANNVPGGQRGGAGSSGGIGGDADAVATAMGVDVFESSLVDIDGVEADQLITRATATGGFGGSGSGPGDGGNGGGAVSGAPVTASAVSSAIGVSGSSNNITATKIVGSDGQFFSATATAMGGNAGIGANNGDPGAASAFARSFGAIGFDGLAVGEFTITNNNVDPSFPWFADATATGGTPGSPPSPIEDDDVGVTELP